MTTITIEQIEARQTELADMITKFKSQPAPTVLAIAPASITLQPGERYAGLLLADDGTPSHHLVLLPGDAEGVGWEDAKAAAEMFGGELPTRREQSLLFANLKGEFTAAWYWSCEPHEKDGSYAWSQGFDGGNQGGSHKSYAGRARAVRRLKA